MIVILIISMIGIFLFFYAINDYKIENIIDLNKEFPVDSSLETELIPSDSVPPVSYDTVYREETAVPETEATETSIIEMNTDPVDTTSEPDETSADTSTEETSDTVIAEETTAPDETTAAA